jgi:hypothetical protein
MPVQQRALQNQYKKATLYAIVFDGMTVKCATALLFGFLLIQPIAPLYAASEDIADENQSEVQIITTEPVTVVEDVQPDVVVDTAPLVTITEATQTDTEDTQTVVVQDNTPEEVTAEETLVDDGTADEDGVINEDDSATTTEDVEDIELEDDTNATTSATSTTETIDEVVIDDEASATTTASTTTDQLVSVHNTSAFSFDTTECAVVGDGAYYCSDKKSDVETFEDGVFSAPDSDGDNEIYIRVKGELMQITHNTIDDNAPHYDGLSNRIVWHTVVNDRYQIVSYTLEDAEMTRLTTTSYNNMEPVAYGDVTLWQAWIDNNWEIMLYDGTTQKQLTNNTLQDVSPHMKDGYIVWQTQFEDGWQVAVYNEETKQVDYIASEGGLKVENPRFVLVYDSTDENGDTKTVGYDFDSKSSFDLGVLPQELPDELPEPDQTGETRALIQNKQTSREGEQEIVDITPQTGGTGTTTPEEGTLDLSQGISTSTPTTTSGIISDVVIPSYDSVSTSSQDTFSTSDVVIPPFPATTTEQVS